MIRYHDLARMFAAVPVTSPPLQRQEAQPAAPLPPTSGARWGKASAFSWSREAATSGRNRQERLSVGGDSEPRAFMRVVEAEGTFALAERLATLYVGGGTPSLLGPAAMEGLAAVLGAHRLAGPELEWTAEANPESLTAELAAAWRRAGVNRLSLGVQSFDHDVLRWMGRLHGPEGGARAVATARGAGITELSVDLIFGLPDEVTRDWDADLDRALALEAPHLSLYGLTIEPGTALGRAAAEGRTQPVDEGRYRDEFLRAAERLASAGYQHYEVSNFALPGHASRHNAVYWGGEPYLGLGNAAHSYRHPLRRWNLRDWEVYRREAAAGRSPRAEEEILDPDQLRMERVWLGLRTREGLALETLTEGARRRARGWEASGLARVEGGRLRLTAEGWLLLDRLAVDLEGDLSAA
ncbi:MAG: coproporphyrinogen III oxidase family protein [Gemmatimonadetes bacterium]|nr:coproporphyrinogen III oxidase family protein [Gemmatimonadota bacterium]